MVSIGYRGDSMIGFGIRTRQDISYIVSLIALELGDSTDIEIHI